MNPSQSRKVPEERVSVSEDAVMSWKQIVAILGGLTALASLHAMFVVPTIMNRVNGLIDEKIEAHMRVTSHREVVTRTEFNQAIIGIQRELDSIGVSLRDIHQKLGK